jgi:hypothetical protein
MCALFAIHSMVCRQESLLLRVCAGGDDAKGNCWPRPFGSRPASWNTSSVGSAAATRQSRATAVWAWSHAQHAQPGCSTMGCGCVCSVAIPLPRPGPRVIYSPLTRPAGQVLSCRSSPSGRKPWLVGWLAGWPAGVPAAFCMQAWWTPSTMPV